MATLEQLEHSGDLVRIEVDLDPGDCAWRRLYGTPSFVEWLQDGLPNFESRVLGLEISPHEQVDAEFEHYIAGRPYLDDKRFKRLSFTPDLSVWEFKTWEIRIFGWVPYSDAFVCTFGDMKDEIEIYGRYGRYMAQTAFARNQLDLDEPKCVVSRELSHVVSSPSQR